VSALARADLRLFELARSAACPPVSDAVGRSAARAYGRLVPAAPLYAAAAAMAASRVYLGVHYPTDVGAGALLGLATGSAAR
jgi:membrane-associated phospholipid phosphatase